MIPYPDTLLYIDGSWRAASDGRVIAVLNPATAGQIGTVAHASRADLDAALAAADRGFQVWRKTSAYDRAKRHIARPGR
jgi:succinate-semialdehyde dehydrogenase / glutarate-semialdehyde dehydrogenase